MTLLSVQDLRVSYGATEVLHHVAMSVRPGDAIGLLGRNGAGKTTLARAITGLKPPSINGGIVEWGDKEITRLPSYKIARLGIAFVPQGRRVFGSLTAGEHLRIAHRSGNSSNPWDPDRVFQLFPSLHLRRDSYARYLSGGEQSMLAIGRALVTNPSLIVMDEPSEGLAPRLVEELAGCIREIQDSGQSLLLIEQNLGFALDIANQITILDRGMTAWTGSPSALLDEKAVIGKHLGIGITGSVVGGGATNG